MARRPICASLFSGCGGTNLGLEASGFQIAVSVEQDPCHAIAHHYNFPYCQTVCQDVTKLGSSFVYNVLDRYKKIDILNYSPPCQGFSMIGLREDDDPRNNLGFEATKLVLSLKPSYVIFENVPGLLTAKYQEVLKRILQLYESHGYECLAPIILNAQDFGVAQIRKRVFFIAYKIGMPTPSYPAPTHGDGLLPYVTAKDVLGDLEDIPIYCDRDRGIDRSEYKSQWIDMFTYDSFRFSYAHQRRTDGKLWGHLGTDHKSEIVDRFERAERGQVEPISHFFKLDPDKPCNTLRAGNGSSRGGFTAARPIHYKHPRCVTIREAARIQSFPDWFQFSRKIWLGHRQIGNSVVPSVAKAIGDEIIKLLDCNLERIPIDCLPKLDVEMLNYKSYEAKKYWE